MNTLKLELNTFKTFPQQASHEKLNEIDSILLESLNNFFIKNTHHSKI